MGPNVGNGARFSAESAILVTPSGKVERVPEGLRCVAPSEWRAALGKGDIVVRLLAPDTLVIDTAGKRVTCRRATAEEARRLEAHPTARSVP